MKDQPNIIFITTDQHRPDAIGMKHPAFSTPNIDELVNEGIRYDLAVCQSPICTPARSSWITGQYIGTHGVWANGVPLPDQKHLLPHLLKHHGYSTAMLGKLHITPSMSTRQPSDGSFGFDTVRLTEGEDLGSYTRWLKENSASDFQKYHHSFPPQKEWDYYTPEESVAEEFHNTRWITDQAIATFQRRVQHKPIFMHVSYPDPHHPFVAPQKYCDLVDETKLGAPIPAPKDWSLLPGFFNDFYEGKDSLITQELKNFDEEAWRKVTIAYYGMITFIDAELGRLLQSLKASGEPTYVIFTADHGELLGDHGLLFKGPYHYDPLIRIPLILSSLGTELKQNGVVNTPVQQIDIMPTILKLCGLKAPITCQGQVLPGIGSPLEQRNYDFALSEQRIPWFNPEIRVSTIRNERYRLSLFTSNALGELYDLDNDPNEENNLWHDKSAADLKADLLVALAQKLMESAPPGHQRTYRA